MKIVVIGGTGLIGSKVVAKLQAQGHEALAASPDKGVNTVTGEGLHEALRGASVVVDVSNSPSFVGDAPLRFFETSTRNILVAEYAAGVSHHVALSVVGTDRLADTDYFRGKLAQEKLIRASEIPYSIVHATQFYEFVMSIAAAGAEGNVVRMAPVLIQPMAAEDVAIAVVKVALDAPLNGLLEVAGPELMRLDALVARGLEARHDGRTVVPDAGARYFGALLAERTLVPDVGARLGTIRFDDWLTRAASPAARQ